MPNYDILLCMVCSSFYQAFLELLYTFCVNETGLFFLQGKVLCTEKFFKRKKFRFELGEKKRGLHVVLRHINRIIIDATNIYHTYILYSLTYTLHTQNDISPPKNIFSSLREIRLHKPDTSPLLYSTQREYLLELGKNN